MQLWLYKGQGLPECIHLYSKVSSRNYHELENQKHCHKAKYPNEICDTLSPCLCLVYVQYLIIRLIIRQLRNAPLSWHYVFDITNMLHLTSTSRGRDKFDLITLKRDNPIVTDIFRVKMSSSMVLN